MNRRTFLTTAAVGGGLALLGGGFFARQAVARGQVHQELMNVSDPVLTSYAAKQLTELPVRAREEMRRHFHTLCLNVHEFTEAVCAPEFADRLSAQANAQEREKLVLMLFMAHVTTPNAVINRVQVVAEGISQELDTNWSACCDELAQQWNVKIKDQSKHLDADLLTARLTPLIGDSIREAADQARKSGKPVALKETFTEFGKSALLLLPLALAAPWIGWPLFAVLAIRPVFQDFIQQARDRAVTLQRSVTEKLAKLGNRVGSEFETEVQARLADLHQWQRQAVDTAARQQAEQLVHLL